ncbi:MAG: threonine/serine dehydratase [Pseudomonadales bacterium]|jgi:threonine dehydratase|nr:threonine/serine dehydratase [Pseudomonadales bacterium]
MQSPPTPEDVLDTARLLRPHVVRTPLLENADLNDRVGGRVLLKAEPLQHTGSFKFRGAMSRLLQLTEAERAAGVVAFSSGNHGQAVAAAGARLGIDVRIVMPESAPAVKLERTRDRGARATTYDPSGPRTREEIAAEIAEREGRVLVPSYDDPYVIAGQGSAGVEVFETLAARDLVADAFLICCGGGGLTAGCALARDALGAEATAIHTVEPAGFDDHARSFVSGEREGIDPDATTFCDALKSPTPGELTFPVTRERVASGLTVDDDEVEDAMRFAFEYLRLVVEPGGAVALAALLAGRIPSRDRTTVVMLSGGNVDATLFSAVIAPRT